MAELQAFGQVFQALGQIQQGKAQDSVAKYNAQVMENQARTVNSQTTVRQEAQRSEARQVIGQQLAAGAESGAALSGSNLDLLNTSLFNAESDALNIRYDGELQSQGLRQQATLERAKGKQAKKQAYMSAAGTLINAGGSYFGGGGKLPSFPGGQTQTLSGTPSLNSFA